LKIAHITDIHISEDGSLIREIDVRKNFQAVMESVSGFTPDLILLGGDLAAEEGEIDAYKWIKSELAKVSIPYLIVPGNHDDVTNLGLVFELEDVEQNDWKFIRQFHELTILGLDSSQGKISDQQLHWLHNSLSLLDKQTLLFLHHPPIDCGCLFMDTKYPLANRNEVFAMIAGCEYIKAIFCGHYHTEKTLLFQGKQIFLTPATTIQMSQTSSSYQVESLRPGWRLIEYSPAHLSTRVVYVD
jgi:Icc protein